MNVRRLVPSLALILIAAGAACSSGSGGPSGAEHAQQTVGSAGGTVATQSGSASVSIPPGALPGDLTITIDSAPNAPAPAAATVVSAPYTFGPEGTTFSQPVTVKLALGSLPAGVSESSVVILTAPAGSSAYTPLPTSIVDASHVSAPTTHFSTFVGVVLSADAGAVDAGALDSGVAEAGNDSGGSDAGPQDATVGDAMADAGTDSGAVETGATDGSAGPDAGPGDAGSNDASACVTPASMFSAPIQPPIYAGIDFSNGGSGDITYAQIAAVDCAGTPNASPSNPGYNEWIWGSGAVVIDFNPSNGIPYNIAFNSGYTGTLSFHSRAGGVWGQHTYVVGVGTLTRDGSPLTINWTGTDGGHDPTITELADAYFATWVPAHAAETTDCVSDKSCAFYPDDGAGHSGFGFRASPSGSFYVFANQGQSTPVYMYSFWLDGTYTPPADAGTD